MHESDTYLAIIDEGQMKHAKKPLLRLGTKRFGPADQATQAKLDAITDLERLDRLIDRLLGASGWKDLLDTRRRAARPSKRAAAFFPLSRRRR